jgi:hypothetical protein
MSRPTLRSACRALLVGLVVLATPAAAWAEEVEGRCFRAHVPSGFRASGSRDEDDACERSFRRRSGSGELRLTIQSFEQDDDAVAGLEMDLGAGLDALELQLEHGDGQTSHEPVTISGAQQAHQVAFVTEEHAEWRLMARRGKQVVTASLSAPASAHAEASDVWSSLVTGLRVEDPSGGGVTAVLPWLVGAVALVALLLRLARRGSTVPVPSPYGMPRPSSTPPVPESASLPYEPSPMPTHAPPLTRESRGGYSRAADGMRTFDATEKADGRSAQALDRLPEVVAKRRTPPPAPPRPEAPARTGSLAPPPPIVRY